MTPASLKVNFFSELKKCGDDIYRRKQHWVKQMAKTQAEADIIGRALSLDPDVIQRKGVWLMNAKLEMLWRVVPYVPSDAVLAWIDCGIAKIFTDTAAIAAAFERLRVPPALGVCVAPGCWPVGPVSKEAVCWRFCGGFFLMGTHFLNTVFYPCFRRVLEESYIQQGRSAWEVNVLADVEREAPSLFQWFAADHNDSMIVGMVGAVDAATAATAATSSRP